MITRLGDFLSELWQKIMEDHLSILVSSLAYYILFSFFPLLLLIVSLLGYLSGFGGQFARFSTQVLSFLPFSSEYLDKALEHILQARGSLGVLGSILLLWSATAVFDILQQILNRIHRAPTMRPLWRRRLFGILLALVLMLFIIISVGVAGLRPLFARYLVELGVFPGGWIRWLVTLLAEGLTIFINFGLFFTLYLFGPSAGRRVGHIWVGSLVAAVLMNICKHLFGIYINSLSTYQMLYGSVGSVIAVLIWIYLAGTFFALGAEVNFVLAARQERGTASLPVG